MPFQSRPVKCSLTSLIETFAMPKATSSTPSSVKQEPYSKESPKKERSQKVAWTEEMDKIMINHILSNAAITFNYDWPTLQKLLPGLSVTQVRELMRHTYDIECLLRARCQLENHWNNKVKKTLFPNEVLKKTKQAKADVKGERSSSQD
jgi:hypothetical protein